jgi:hypothetical protein
MRATFEERWSDAAEVLYDMGFPSMMREDFSLPPA